MIGVFVSHRRSGVSTTQVRELLSDARHIVIPEPRTSETAVHISAAARRREAQARKNRRIDRDRQIDRRELRSTFIDQMAEVTVRTVRHPAFI